MGTSELVEKSDKNTGSQASHSLNKSGKLEDFNLLLYVTYYKYQSCMLTPMNY